MIRTVCKTSFKISLLTLVALALPRAADAQMLRFGLAAGPTTPVGDYSDVVDTGFHLRGLAALRVPLVPLGFRGELVFNRMPRVDTGHVNQFSAIANGTYMLLPTPVVSPYLIGGAGIYRTQLGGDEGSSVDLGLNGGIGLRANLLVAELFAEARYEHVLGGDGRPRMIPLTIGVMF